MRRTWYLTAAAMLLGACEAPIYSGGVRSCAEGMTQVGEACMSSAIWYALLFVPVGIVIWATVRFFDFMRTVESRLRSLNESVDKLTPKD